MNLPARLRAVQKRLAGKAGNIPPEQRWWCEICSCSDEQRQICLHEHYTWDDFLADWIAAGTEDEPANVAAG